MSEAPEHITDSELSDLMALAALWEPGLKVRCDNADTQAVKAVARLADAAPRLITEVRRLKDIVDAKPTGDEYAVRVRELQEAERRLKGAEELLDRRGEKLQQAQDLLLERARQADDLIEQRDYWKARADERALRISQLEAAR